MPEFTYEEVEAWRVPVVKRVAADLMRDAVEDDLGFSFGIKWFRPADYEARLYDLEKRVARLTGEVGPAWRSFVVSDSAMSGRARPSEPEVVWVSAAQDARDCALTVAHEAKHLQQYRDGILPAFKAWCSEGMCRASESDAAAYEVKAAGWVPSSEGGVTGKLERKSLMVKATEDAGVFEGHASTWGNVDLQGDLVMRGAFGADLGENGNKRPVLFQHDTNREIGIGAFLEDDKGLWVGGRLYFDPNDASVGVQDARESWVRMKFRERAGMPQQMSIGYRAIKARRANGVRELHSIRLYEASLVTFPANTLATVRSVR